MEYDRYENHNKLYILGIICLLCAMGFFLFSMFITPYLIWSLKYDVPDMINNLIAFFEYNYNLSPTESRLIVWLIFFLPSLITGYVSYYISNQIDDQIYGFDAPESDVDETVAAAEVRQRWQVSLGLGAKILFLMMVIVAAILLLHLLIQYI